MKKEIWLGWSVFVFIMVSFVQLQAQQAGAIKYKETVKMDIQLDGDGPQGIDLSKYLPESTTFYKELHFNGPQSVYIRDQDGEKQEDTEIESDDGAFKMVIKTDDGTEEIRYIDRDKKEMVFQTGFMGKSFVIQEPIEKTKWKITGEKIKFLEYECTKATAEIDSQSVVAWFTPQIAAQIGPRRYSGLPGAILMLSFDGDKTEIMATEVNLGASDYKITKPKDGKKVSKEQYDKIVDEKMKEMRESSHGDGHFIIRG